MSDFYRENILEHYKHPRNYGSLKKPDSFAEDTNPLCGDRMKFELRHKAGIITGIAFTAEGCALSIASASLLSEYVKGKNIAEVLKLDHNSMRELLEIEISSGRIKCALLPLSALCKAVTHKQKNYG